MFNAGERIDPLTLTAYLRETKRLEKAGGPLAISELPDVSAPTAASGAAMVREKYRERRAIEIGDQLRNGELTGEEAENRLGELRNNASSASARAGELLVKFRFNQAEPPPARCRSTAWPAVRSQRGRTSW
jgi:replicative DNA helicase